MRLLLAGAALALGALAFGADITPAEVLAGKVVPLTIKLGSLDDAWSQATLDVQAGASLDQIVQQRNAPGASSLFTTGETLTLGGETFLVTYQVFVSDVDLQAMTERSEPPAPLTADTALTLNLVNLRHLAALRNIRPVDLQQVLTPVVATPPQAALAATRRQSVHNIRQISDAIMMWCHDHDEMLPPAAGVWSQLDLDKGALVHPVSKEPYVYNTLLADLALFRVGDPAATVLVYEPAPDEEGKRAVGYLDGHVELVDDATFTKKLAADQAAFTRETQVRGRLNLLRAALQRFEADMGVYPKSLRDLIAADAGALSTPYPAKAHYHGPYLAPNPNGADSIPGFPGIPANPLLAPDAPAYHVLGTHWDYNTATGAIRSRAKGTIQGRDSRWEDL